MIRIILAALLLLLPLRAFAQDLTVFAAASLTDAMKDIGTVWEGRGQPKPRFNFAASSTLARQMEQGAPANLFASADEQWMDWAQQRNLIANETRRTLLGNDLVLVMPRDKMRPQAIGPGWDLMALLGADGRLAVGDPSNVPAGIYAKQALTKLGIWPAVQNRLASSDSVRSALLLVERAEAPAGIVYSTDAAVAPGVAIAGTFPADTHDKISYPFAVTRSGDTPAARAFLAFLAGPEAGAIFARRGFKTE
jgi:molybdate transport system substrate-binding protein